MAPPKKHPRKSTASATSESKQRITYPQLLPTRTASPIKSPKRSPAKRRYGITQTQKELFIHNLQLEITFKARGLRAQANFEAAQLRSTLEQRLQRIPMAVRKANLGELLDKHSRPQQSQPPATFAAVSSSFSTAPVSQTYNPSENTGQSSGQRDARTRAVKRSSHEAGITSDKENSSVNNPKKRTRTAKIAATASETLRPISATQILSPKSNNARRLPLQSPSRLPISPSKAAIPRATSPIKPMALPKAAARPAPPKGAARAPARTASTTRTKRAAPAASTAPMRRRSNASDRSSSAATTIVTKGRKVTGPVQTAAAAKKKIGAFGGVPAKGKRVAAAVGKMEGRSAAGAVTGPTRVLRKRA